MNLCQCLRVNSIVYFVSGIEYDTEVYNWYSDVDYCHTYFQILISSTFLFHVYGLMRGILYPIFIPPYCNLTVPFIQHCVILNTPLYGF